MHRALLVLTLALAAAGCRQPDPAPTELSDLLQFAWAHYDLDEPTNEISLADAAANFEAWFVSEVESLADYDLEVGFGGTLTEAEDRLHAALLEGLEPPPQNADGAEAVGVVVAIHTDCSLADMDRVYTTDDQLSLFPDNYVTYEREDTGNYDCFLEGSCDEFFWTSVIENSLPLNTTAAFQLHNRMRRIDAESLGGEPVQGRLSRTWMSTPATLTPDIGKWHQNYQMEFIYERPDHDGVLHIYPQWVEVQLGALNTEAVSFLNAYLDGLLEYILELEQHCLDG